MSSSRANRGSERRDESGAASSQATSNGESAYAITVII